MYRANSLNTEIRLDSIRCEAFRLYISKVLYYKENTTQLLVNSIRQPALQPIALPSVLPVNAITAKQPASKRGRLLSFNTLQFHIAETLRTRYGSSAINLTDLLGARLCMASRWVPSFPHR